MTVHYGGKTFLPNDGFPWWENFPSLAISRHHRATGRSLGSTPWWNKDPWGVPRKKRHVEFVAEGPAAREAIQVIKDELAKPLSSSPEDALQHALTVVRAHFKDMSSNPEGTRTVRYRPRRGAA